MGLHCKRFFRKIKRMSHKEFTKALITNSIITVKILMSFRLSYGPVTVFRPKVHTVTLPLPTVTGNGQ